MLKERDIRVMYEEHKGVLKNPMLSETAREFYKTRLELLDFILHAQVVRREPPTNNSTLGDF